MAHSFVSLLVMWIVSMTVFSFLVHYLCDVLQLCFDPVVEEREALFLYFLFAVLLLLLLLLRSVVFFVMATIANIYFVVLTPTLSCVQI